MKFVHFALCIALAAGAINCSMISVRTDHDPNINFSKYKTFNWIPGPAETRSYPSSNIPLLKKNVQYVVNQTLTAKGYQIETSAETETDFLIACQVVFEDKVDVTNWGYNYGAWRGRSQRYYNYWGPAYGRGYETQTYEYTEGRLILDFIDSKSKELIWRGMATGVVDNYGSGESQIYEAVNRMLEKFPPQ